MEDSREQSAGFSRRTVVKGAAWSVPVIAAAVATPLAAASTVTWNGAVAGNCSGNYDLSLLESIVGTGLTLGLVQTALGALGLQPNATREFTITATTGDIPAGTTYLLTDPNALLNVGGLESVIGAGVAGVASTTGGFILTLAAPIAQGTSVTVDVYRALVNVGALSSFTLTQTVSDAVAGDNSATMSSLLAASVNLGSLGILGVSGSLTVQTCG